MTPWLGRFDLMGSFKSAPGGSKLLKGLKNPLMLAPLLAPQAALAAAVNDPWLTQPSSGGNPLQGIVDLNKDLLNFLT